MKNQHYHKKTFGLRLALSSVLLAVLVVVPLLSVFSSGRAAADFSTPPDITSGTFTFQDQGNIVGDFGNNGKVTFTDGDISDSHHNYSSDTFCDPGTIQGQNGVDGGIKFGINLSGNPNFSAANISAQVKLGYKQGTNCVGVLFNTSIANPGSAAAAVAQWDGNNITNLDGANDTVTLAPGPNTPNLYIDSSKSSCGADEAILLDAGSDNQGTLYVFAPGGIRGGIPAKSIPAIAQDFNSNCFVIGGGSHITIAGTRGTSKNNPGTGSQCSTDSSGNCKNTQDSTLDCGGGALNWIVCPVITAAQGAAEQIDTFITDSLDVDVSNIFDNTQKGGSAQNGYYQAWNSFRILAIAGLIIAGLIMIASQAFGFEFLDAYTIRKVLPRLIIAVLGISLSWPLLRYAVNFFDVLGFDVRDLIYSPFRNLPGSIGVGVGVASYFAVAAGAFVLGFTSLTFILTGLLAGFIAFVLLIIRQIALIIIIILSPIAIACFILPNTQRVWKQWRDEFLGLMLVFPIISAFIAAGHVFAAVSLSKGSGPTGSNLSQIIGILAYFAPYFLIPFAFRLATGTITNIGGLINDRSRGAFDRLKNVRKAGAAKRFQDLQSGHRFKGGTENNRRGAINNRLQQASLIGSAGYNPKNWKSRIAGAQSARTTALSGKAAEDEAVQAVLGVDDLLKASLHGDRSEKSARAYLSGLGQTGAVLEQNVASVMQARERVGYENFQDLAVAANAGTGTGYAGGQAEMLEMINSVAKGDRARAGRMLNSARGQAERAKRVDLYGSSFGGSAAQMDLLHDGRITGQQADEFLSDQVLNAKSAGEIGSARNGGLKNMVPALERRMDKSTNEVLAARASGDTARIERAENEHKRIMAHTASVLDVAGSVSPENAKLLGDTVMARDTVADEYEEVPVIGPSGSAAVSPLTNRVITERRKTGNKVRATVGATIEGLRSDEIFGRYRREYGQQSTTAAAAAAAGGIVPPPGAPGAGGAPGS